MSSKNMVIIILENIYVEITSRLSRSRKLDLVYFIFLFNLFFYFLFLEQLGLGLIGHAVTTVTI